MMNTPTHAQSHHKHLPEVVHVSTLAQVPAAHRICVGTHAPICVLSRVGSHMIASELC